MRYARVPLEGPRMTEAANRDLSYLSPAAHGLGAVFARPKLIAFACIAALAGLGWFVLGLQAAGVGLFEVLCRPLAAGGAGSRGPAATGQAESSNAGFAHFGSSPKW